MRGLGCEVVVQLVLALELEDEGVGHAFAEGFPGAVLAYNTKTSHINNLITSWRVEWGIDIGSRERGDVPAFMDLIRGLPVFALMELCFRDMKASKWLSNADQGMSGLYLKSTMWVIVSAIVTGGAVSKNGSPMC